MDRIQFKQHIDLLREELVSAIISYEMYQNILTDRQERLDAINSFHVFFTAVAQGCRDTVYLSLIQYL